MQYCGCAILTTDAVPTCCFIHVLGCLKSI